MENHQWLGIIGLGAIDRISEGREHRYREASFGKNGTTIRAIQNETK